MTITSEFGHRTTTFNITTSLTYYLAEGASIITADEGILGEDMVSTDSYSVIVDGAIVSESFAIRLAGDTSGGTMEGGEARLDVGATGSLRGTGLDVAALIMGERATLTNSGEIIGDMGGAGIGGPGVATVFNSGIIHGTQIGLYSAYAEFVDIRNSGEITSALVGYLALESAQVSLVNSGKISAATGVAANGCALNVQNSGSIIAGEPMDSTPSVFGEPGWAISLVDSGTGVPPFTLPFTPPDIASLHLDNSGLISGTRGAIHGESLVDIVTNSGVIFGDVNLAGGRDELRNTGEILSRVRMGNGADSVIDTGLLGEVLLGNGNDSYDGRRGTTSSVISGNDGDDVIRAGGGDDILGGGDGRDLLRGGRGDDSLAGGRRADVLIGGKGEDRLNGGLGADTFVLTRRNGDDLLADFADGVDQIDISALGLDRFAEIRDIWVQSGTDVLIDLALVGCEGSLLMLDTDIADLGREDFIF